MTAENDNKNKRREKNSDRYEYDYTDYRKAKVCPICSLGFPSQQALDEHMESEHHRLSYGR
jgi:hypothetical protein